MYHTAITVKMVGLEGAPGNKWHVHVDDVPYFTDCAATGGHYDPLTAETLPPRGDYEIGDLSGKWGTLHNTTVDFTGGFMGGSQGYVLDEQLPLFGNYSVYGRSIVIHRKDEPYAHMTKRDGC